MDIFYLDEVEKWNYSDYEEAMIDVLSRKYMRKAGINFALKSFIGTVFLDY